MTNEDFVKQVADAKTSNFERLHSIELANIGKNFTLEEQVDICKVIPSQVIIDEIQRRRSELVTICNEIVIKVTEFNDGMIKDLPDMERFIATIRKIVRLDNGQ